MCNWYLPIHECKALTISTYTCKVRFVFRDFHNQLRAVSFHFRITSCHDATQLCTLSEHAVKCIYNYITSTVTINGALDLTACSDNVYNCVVS